MSIALDPQGRPYVLDEQTGTATPVAMLDHPLAHESGVRALLLMVSLSEIYRHLTPAQRACVTDPTTGRTRPWKALVDKGLASEPGVLTDLGELVRRTRIALARVRP